MKPSLRSFGWIVVRDVNRTFGGGVAAMELLRRTGGKAGWLDASEHALLVAVSRLTPGTNILSYSVALGWKLHRLGGSLVALVASSLPAALIVWGLSAALVSVDRYPAVQALLAVAMLVAAVLVFSAAWHLLKPHVVSRAWRAALIAAVAVTLQVLEVTPVRTLIIAAVIGAALGLPEPRAAGRPPVRPEAG